MRQYIFFKYFLIILSFFSISLVAQSNNEFYLLTTLYNEHNQKRIEEYQECLDRNCSNQYIKKIVVFLEGATKVNLKHPKIEIVPIKSRPSYRSFMQYALKKLHHKVVMIANADIYFDQTLKLFNNYKWNNKFLALTRYEHYKNSTWKRHRNSFDVWIYHTSLLNKYPTQELQLGLPAHDVRFVYQMKKMGAIISNPSLSIKTWHIDSTSPKSKPYKNNYEDYQKLLNNHEFRQALVSLKNFSFSYL